MFHRDHFHHPLMHRARLAVGLGIVLLVVAAFPYIMTNVDSSSNAEDRGVGIVMGGAFAAFGLLSLALGLRLPTRQVMQLAKASHGLLTLSEIVTTLDISPARALRTLKQLQKVGIASQRWQEFRKNIWEFPDYMTLPITESIELARSKDGRLTVEDLLNSGHSAETARQTFEALSEKGLAQRDPASAAPALIITTQ